MILVFLILRVTFCAAHIDEELLNFVEPESYFNDTESRLFINILNDRDVDIPDRGKYEDSVQYAEKVVTEMLKDRCFTQACSDFGIAHKRAKARMVAMLTDFPAVENTEPPNNDFQHFLVLVDALLKRVRQLKNENAHSVLKSVIFSAIKSREDTDDIQVTLRDFVDFPVTNVVLQSSTDPANDYSSGFDTWGEIRTGPSPVTDSESIIDYFREDSNLHRFHLAWHYKDGETNSNKQTLPRGRRGASFFHMHRIMLFRYFMERHIEGMIPVQPLDHRARREGFTSVYNIPVSKRNHYGDFASSSETCKIPIEKANEMIEEEQKCDSARESVEQLGERCGQYHALGHILTSKFCVSDRDRHQRRLSIMTSSKVSARDPLFYRWHYQVDLLYQTFLDKQRSYDRSQLLPPSGVKVNGISVYSVCEDVKDVVETFWTYSAESHKMSGTNYQLNHEKFDIKIQLKNDERSSNKVIVRIYLGLDEFIDDAKWFVELDRFTHQLSGEVHETITRQDRQTTSSWRNHDGSSDECGWPQNLLLPKGRLDDFTRLRLVVFVNDVDPNVNEGMTSDDTFIMCGIVWSHRNHKFVSDPRDYGFPLNRRWQGVDKARVLNNGDSAFGMVSSVLNIYHRGKNETACHRTPLTHQTTTNTASTTNTITTTTTTTTTTMTSTTTTTTATTTTATTTTTTTTSTTTTTTTSTTITTAVKNTTTTTRSTTTATASTIKAKEFSTPIIITATPPTKTASTNFAPTIDTTKTAATTAATRSLRRISTTDSVSVENYDYEPSAAPVFWSHVSRGCPPNTKPVTYISKESLPSLFDKFSGFLPSSFGFWTPGKRSKNEMVTYEADSAPEEDCRFITQHGINTFISKKCATQLLRGAATPMHMLCEYEDPELGHL